MNIIERISNEIFEKTGHAPEEFQLIREKGGISVFRCRYRGKSAVAKYFEREEDRREIDIYRFLAKEIPDTPELYALGRSCILMEDLENSDTWRLGTEEDLADEKTAVLIARWYFLLHHKCGGVYHIDYSEAELLSPEGVALLREKLPEAEELWAYLDQHCGAIQAALWERFPVINYNDFYWTNLAVRKDGAAAMMFDYNLMGRGYAYADMRNVTSSLSEAAGRAFTKEYRNLYRVQYEKEMDFSEEKQVDDVISPLCGLISAYSRETFPRWAEELKESALDGTLLEKARVLAQKMKRKELKQHLYEYLPFNEQEERDLKVITDALASEWEKKSGRNALFALEGCGEELFVRENLAMHMTASAWVVSPDRKHVLMAYHNLYHSWAWLGGHADGEADLMEVARREVMEESGVKNVRPLMNTIFSVEILTVDGHEKRGKYVPSHLHLNVTYLFEADMDEELRVKEDENSAVGWIPVDEVAERVSEPWMMKRIYAKLMKKAEQLESMKRILLCADDEPTVFAVPDAVAEHLDDYCEEFIQWMQTSPDAERYREMHGDVVAFCFWETDFIRYLNEHVFPEQRSFAVQRWIEDGMAEEYKDLPYYCF